MKRWNKLIPVALAAAMAAIATPAQAAHVINIEGPSGTFGNNAVTCDVGVATCAFVNEFTFLTPEGFNLVNATISTSALGGNNIDFTSVLLNGAAFTLDPTGVFEQGTLASLSLMAGMTNTLTVTGQNTGNSAFAGNLTFAAVSGVPEPGTWAMMLMGFGAVGFSMRRRKRSDMRLMQVA